MMEEFKKKWTEIKRKRRIEIHINSLSIGEMKRMSMEKFLQRENSQISRIFSVKNSLVDVIYICPFTLTNEIIGYYSKVLEIGEIENPNSRFNIVVPENYIKFPAHLPTSSILLYSPKALKRIKWLIKSKQAYIVPGIPSTDDIKLSMELGVPLLSGEPQKAQLYSTKSGCRRILNLADVPIPIGAYDIYDENEFEITLTKLILNHLHINTWVFKIDDEFSGRGHASYNIEHLKFVKDLRNKKAEVTEPLIQKLQDRVRKDLPRKVKIAMPTLYRNWNAFIADFCTIGGVIEAAPNCPPSSIFSPSVAFLIGKCLECWVLIFCVEPDGNVEVIGSFDKFHGREFVNAGCFFPQTSLPNMVILEF
jgi:IQ domain-containing protein H